jgi:hypothetical protein
LLHPLPAGRARAVTVLVRRRDAFVSTALDRFMDMARTNLRGTNSSGAAVSSKVAAANDKIPSTRQRDRRAQQQTD